MVTNKFTRFNSIRCIIALFILMQFSGCGPSGQQPVEIDFSPRASSAPIATPGDTLRVLSVAIAPVISPKESFVYYKELFDYMGDRLNMKIEFKQRMSYAEVNSMLERDIVDLAFICTGAYVDGSESMDLLAGPVFRGKPFYHAYIITNINSPIEVFEDLKGKSFAYTDPLSHTGKLYPMKRIIDLELDTASFFNKTVYSGSHDVSIQMVARNLIDGASVSGLIYEYMQSSQPELMKNLRIIEVSEPFGVPPIVTSLLLDPEIKKQVKDLFLNLHKDAQGREILDKLLIDKFDIIEDSMYTSIRKISETVWE